MSVPDVRRYSLSYGIMTGTPIVGWYPQQVRRFKRTKGRKDYWCTECGEQIFRGNDHWCNSDSTARLHLNCGKACDVSV